MLSRFPNKNFTNLLSKATKFTLPKLEYGYEDLEPIFSKELLELHNAKHHKTYIDNYNSLFDDYGKALEAGDVKTIESLTSQINFNAGSHLNHSTFWKKFNFNTK